MGTGACSSARLEWGSAFGAPVAGRLLALLPTLALSYVLFLYLLLGFLDTGQSPSGLITSRTQDKIHSLAIFVVTVSLPDGGFGECRCDWEFNAAEVGATSSSFSKFESYQAA